MHSTDAIEILTVALLRYGDAYLLLKRNQNKAFAPGRWTGPGGHVEADELSRLRAAALREVAEETGYQEEMLRGFVLRRALLANRPGKPVNVVLYFTGQVDHPATPDCPEGTLAWKREAEFETLDLIETTRQVFPRLIGDMQRDEAGNELPVMGLAVFDRSGVFQQVVWAEP